MRFFFLLCSLVVIGLSSCGPKAAGPRAGSAEPVRDAEVTRVVAGMAANAVDTRYLDARARVDLRSEKLNIGGTATIRLEKDRAIWMVVKKFGFEGARVLIQPDSFFLTNRLSGEYVAEPLSYLEEKYKVPARFDLLQDIILGNAVFFTDDLRVRTEAGNYVLSGRDAQFDTRYVVDPGSFQLRQMELNEIAQGRSLVVENDDYEQLDGLARPFPTERRVSVDGGSEGLAGLDMSFDRMKFSGPLSMPFSKR